MTAAVCKPGPKVMTRKGETPDHVLAMSMPMPKAGSSSWLGQDGKPVNVSGNNGALVADVLTRIDDLMKFNDFMFGVRGYGGNVILTDNGTNGGAFHMGCDFVNGGDWYEALYSPPSPAGQPGGITFGLVQAEVVESYMGIAFNGGVKTIDCGDSFGEALSRYLAMSVTGGTNGSMGTSGFVSATSWDGSNWIDRLSGTDGDYSSTGCGMVYISWMLKQGHTLDKITQAGGPTCADNYAALTGKPSSHAWPDFQAALSAIGGMGAIRNDNPFGAPDPVYPLSTGPTALGLSASPSSGPIPLSVSFSVTGNSAGGSLDFGDSTPPATTFPTSHVYSSPNTYTATLKTATETASATISAGVSPPPPPPPIPHPVVVIPSQSIQVGVFGRTVTIPGQTVPVTDASSAPSPGVINPALFGDVIALFLAFLSKNPAAISAALAKLLADLGLGAQDAARHAERLTPIIVKQLESVHLNPAIFGDVIALFLAFLSKNPVAISAALAKLLADLGLGG